jgi:hypothetical protein
MSKSRNWIIAALIVYNCLTLVANAYLKFIDPAYAAEMQIDFRMEIIAYSLINLALLAALIASNWRNMSHE